MELVLDDEGSSHVVDYDHGVGQSEHDEAEGEAGGGDHILIDVDDATEVELSGLAEGFTTEGVFEYGDDEGEDGEEPEVGLPAEGILEVASEEGCEDGTRGPDDGEDTEVMFEFVACEDVDEVGSFGNDDEGYGDAVEDAHSVD